jgi:N-acetylmuramoyl-L-alanine amidase
VTRATLRGVALALGLLLARPGAGGGAEIAIDIGHSRLQPGARSARGVPEYRFNRQLAGAIDRQLRRAGFATRLIGARGDSVDNLARAKLASGAAFLLSVHHDSVQRGFLKGWTWNGAAGAYSEGFTGFSLFVSRRNPRWAESLACASRMGAELQRRGFTPSRYHAEPIPGENRPFADPANGVHYFDELVGIGAAPVPAVLLEAGVIVDRDEEVRLARPATQIRIAAAVSAALAACLAPSSR